MRFTHLFTVVMLMQLMPNPTLAQEPWVTLYTTNSPESMQGQDMKHVVARGETLLGVLNSRYDGTEHMQQLVGQVVADNPRAFHGGSPDRMIEGQTLILPAAHQGPTAADDIYLF
jgi:Tfp pilus assembly protein FimV